LEDLAPTGWSSAIDEGLAQKAQETVIHIIQAGRTARKAWEVAFSAFMWADHLFDRLESETPLPRPLVCQTGCSFCCFNQVEVTPPEALLIGDFVEHWFTAAEKAGLRESLNRGILIKAGKSKKEIAHLRRELPCPLLRDDRCAVYRVRPLVCRAMHSLDAKQCELEWESNSFRGVEHYAHRQEITASLAQGLLAGCREMGCQSGTLDLVQALRDFFQAPSPLEQWIQGQQVFRSLPPPGSNRALGIRPGA
jgi:Fe-S-cluster containining protein